MAQRKGKIEKLSNMSSHQGLVEANSNKIFSVYEYKGLHSPDSRKVCCFRIYWFFRKSMS